MLINDIITARVIAANYNEAATYRIPYLGEGLFPIYKKVGLDLSFAKAHNGAPVTLAPSAFDAKATYRDRPAFDVISGEMPFFREGFKIKERDRQEILKIRDLDDPALDYIIDNIFADARNLVDGARTAAERMRMQLLFPANGNLGVSIQANNVDYTYDYDPNGEWKGTNFIALSGTSLWTDSANADVFEQIDAAATVAGNASGDEPRYLVMNGYTFGLLRKSAEVRGTVMNIANGALAFVSDEEVRRVIRDNFGIDIVVYNKTYRDESGTERKFVPDGYVALIPEGALGRTAMGTTPEEADLLGGTEADVELVDEGIAITVEKQAHPVNTNIFASMIALPTFERMDEVVVMKVVA